MNTLNSISQNPDEIMLPAEWALILQAIHARLDDEAKSKQAIIEMQLSKIARLEKELSHQQEMLFEKEKALMTCKNESEGKRQLINKLLGDLERLHQDIEWYKKTYEKRSFLGTIRQKLFK